MEPKRSVQKVLYAVGYNAKAGRYITREKVTANDAETVIQSLLSNPLITFVKLEEHYEPV